MAEKARSIPKKIKEKLLHEAGGKCANPGCDNLRLQIHHIMHWAVYKTHDARHMIAVCPACHDACHHGKLKITDELLYQWKTLSVGNEHAEAHVFVSSSSTTRVSVGTLSFQQPKERRTLIFDLASKNKLEFSVSNEYLKVSATLTDRENRTIFKVIDNNIKVISDKEIVMTQRVGKFRITVPVNKFYLPATALRLMRNSEPDYGADGTLIAIDIEVIKPGHVRIQGFWPDDNAAIVITEKSINFCRYGGIDFLTAHPLSLTGQGDSSTLIFDGPANQPMFRFERP